MAVAGAVETPTRTAPYSGERLQELKAFDDTKLGVKGLLDAGVARVPRIFHLPAQDEARELTLNSDSEGIPIIDLSGVEEAGRRREIVEEMREVLESWGFFQVVNHGVPQRVLDEMIGGVRRFNEQPDAAKMEMYSRDAKIRVRFLSNFDLFHAPAANWRDTLLCRMAPDLEDPSELPQICRDELLEYSKYMKQLGDTMFELISEVVGLKSSYLKDLGCMDGHVLLSHYYPECPEPELTMGSSKHSDSDFLTLLLQDQIGGLQVLHQEYQWVNVPPVRGALVVNIGDLLQLITNGKLKSVVHRVQANRVGPRISVACFFTTHLFPSTKLFGPIKELLSEDNPPKYRETTAVDYVEYFNSIGLGGEAPLNHYRL